MPDLSITESISAETSGDAQLVTERAPVTTLRPLTKDDAARFHQLINEWEICRLLPQAPFPYPETQAQAWIDAAIADRAHGRVHEFAVTDESGVMIGCAGLRLEKSGRRAALGYWIGRRFWGRGHGTAAVAHLLRWGFDTLTVDTITASVATDNAASLAVLHSNGFSETGTGHAKFICQPDARRPVQHLAITREALAVQSLSLATETPTTEAPAIDAKPLLLVAACALIDKHGQVLLARRPPGRKLAGLWEFPGGKLAPGETPEQALVRELDEELGITVREADLAPFAFASHEYDSFHLLMPLYLSRRWAGTPQPREGQNLAWVMPSQLDEYPMPPADRPLIPLLRDFL